MWTQIRLLLLEQSDLDLHGLLKRLQNISVDNKHILFVIHVCALRLYKCEVTEYTVRIFMECALVCAA